MWTFTSKIPGCESWELTLFSKTSARSSRGLGPCSPVPRRARLQQRSHRGGHSRKAAPSPMGKRPEWQAPPHGSPWPPHRRGVTAPGLSLALGERSGRLPGVQRVPNTWVPGCRDISPRLPPHPKEESTDRTRPLTSYPGSPRGPGGPLAGCKTQENGEREAAEPGRGGGPGAGVAHSPGTRRSSTAEEGTGDTSESPGTATLAARAQPAAGQTGAGDAMVRGGGWGGLTTCSTLFF